MLIKAEVVTGTVGSPHSEGKKAVGEMVILDAASFAALEAVGVVKKWEEVATVVEVVEEKKSKRGQRK